MDNILLKDAKEKLNDLEINYSAIYNELAEIKSRKEVYILGSRYNNGVYLQSFEIGYEDTIDFLKLLLKKYDYEIQRAKETIIIIEELLNL